MGDPVDQLLSPAYHHLHFQSNYQNSSSAQNSQNNQNEIYSPSLYRNPSRPSSPSHTTHRNSPVQDIFHHIHHQSAIPSPDIDSNNHNTIQDDPNVDEEPLYVNAKQYFRILKRRVARARLEEVHRLSRQRKPYLHESRHKHAMRRPRGPGGRFLTAEEIAAQKLAQQGAPSASNDDTGDDDPEDHCTPMNIDKQEGHSPALIDSADSRSHEEQPLSSIPHQLLQPQVMQHRDPYGRILPQGSSAVSLTGPYHHNNPSSPSLSPQLAHSYPDPGGVGHMSTPVTTQPPSLPTNPQPTALMPGHPQHSSNTSAPVTLRSPYPSAQMHHVPHPHAHTRLRHSHLHFSENLYPADEAVQASSSSDMQRRSDTMMSYGNRSTNQLDDSGR
ncbi:CCAAT-binding transcription factor (CBF-B/NF-YA) subunit B-domain-containing protein [Phlebopus sp. FC_14]|nr:CCAAT-binding transcription factor (CBF-B/NF-YA) subunit B-domain-containing protein [Phlebopus sp. FC_14]